MAVGAGDGNNNNNNENNNNNHNNKRVTRRSAALSLQPEQRQSHPDDFALALALQEQENAFGMQPLNENHGIRESQDGQSSAFLNDDNEEEEYEDEDEEEYDEEDFEFFNSQEIDGVELELLEGEETNGDDDMEEDDIDPDELSYEELIALGEVVGEENRGLSTQEISSCLTKYTPPSIDSKTIIDLCVICQVDYEKLDGQGGEEKLVALPCEHSYHLDCITTWLQLRKVCPICAAEVSLPKSSGS